MARWMRRLAIWTAATAVAVAALGLSGCNTIEGVGRDMQGLGRYMADTAEDANPYGP